MFPVFLPMDRAAVWLSMVRGSCVYIEETHLVLALWNIPSGQDLLQCQQRLLPQRLGWGGAAHAGAKVPLSKHKNIVQREKL